MQRPSSSKQSATPPTHTLVSAIAAALLACGAAASCDTSSDDDYLPVCVNQVTGVRAPDSACGLDENGDAVAAASTHLAWDYLLYSSLSRDYYLGGVGTRINTTNVTVIHNYPPGGRAAVDTGVPAGGGKAATVRDNLVNAKSAAAGKAAANPNVQRGGLGASAKGASSDSAVGRSAGS